MNKKKDETKEVAKFKEFKYSGKVFEYDGRIYQPEEGKGKVKRRWYLSLTLNNAVTIKGCHLVETEDKVFITYPQYLKNKDKNTWESYIFVDKELNDEIDTLISEIAELVDKW